MRYAELQCASHFSFLRGASSPDELFAQAEACGLDALAITDRNTLAGIVRAHAAAKLAAVRPIAGCRLALSEGQSRLVYPINRAGYPRLCRSPRPGKTRGANAKYVVGRARGGR